MSDLIQLYANANIRIGELERENAELRKTLLLITQKHESISELFTSYEDCAANLAATASAALKKLQ